MLKLYSCDRCNVVYSVKPDSCKTIISLEKRTHLGYPDPNGESVDITEIEYCDSESFTELEVRA